MKLIAATNPIPGLGDIFKCNPVNPQGCPNPISRIPGATNFNTLGDVISGFLNIIFYIAVFAAFYYLIWGAFNYIMAQGKKEDLAKARDKITWALVGLIIVILAYFMARFISEILKTNTKGYIPF